MKWSKPQKMNYRYLLLPLLALCWAASAQAASFDCAKATLPAEKFVCDNPFISALDDKLDTIYKSVLAKASAEQKQQVMAQQKHWLKYTRNVCDQEVCFKHAYWTRQAELATFFEPKSPLYAKESDKATAIQKILAEAPLYPSTQSDPMCGQVFTALKEMRGIRFVDPVVQTMSYEDPALDPWKRRGGQILYAEKCVPNVPLTFSYICIPPYQSIADISDDIGSDLMNCEAWYGLPPFKIFELPPLKPTEKTRYVFYEDSTYGPINREREPSYPIRVDGYFTELFSERCQGNDEDSVFVQTRIGNKRDGPNFNSVIVYQQRYFILALERIRGDFWLNIQPIDTHNACSWGPVQHVLN